MRSATLAIALGVTAFGTSSSQDLTVLRTSPSTPADRTASVVVTFDRPVAGGLESTVSAEDFFRMTPSVEGTVRWRDPVTMVFEPEEILPSETTYIVTVREGLVAMDGSRLSKAHTFEFRTAPAQILDGFPVGTGRAPEHLGPEPTFLFALDSPVPPDLLASGTYLNTEAPCREESIPVRAVSDRPVEPEDERRMYRIRRRGNRNGADHRRVIELAPVRPLPSGCRVVMQLPLEIPRNYANDPKWSFRTRGPLSVTGAVCGGKFCPTGPIGITFSNPVRGAEILRHVELDPTVEFSVGDTAKESTHWALKAELPPRTEWTLVVGRGLTDVFGGTLQSDVVDTVRTTGYEPMVSYDHGRQIVELGGPRTLAVQHLNVDTLIVERILVADSLESLLLEQRWGLGDVWRGMAAEIDTLLIPVTSAEDKGQISGLALRPRLPGASGGTLQMIQVSARDARTATYWQAPIALLQVTDLAVHSRVGVDQAAVWVTGVGDGLGTAGVEVTLHGQGGEALAEGVTDSDGLLILDDLGEVCGDCADGYITASRGDDRAVISLNDNEYDLSPWAFGARRGWGIQREAVAAAVFTERGIYRPGEPVYAKAIVRDGMLGQLKAMAEDSLRWAFYDRDGGRLQDTVVALSEFGTSDQSLEIPEGASLGTYRIEAQLHRDGKWTSYANAYYRVAEYRPPEFLVDAVASDEPKFSGDSVKAAVSGRYLFGAPMRGVPISWQARREPVSAWSLRIPGLDGWQVGSSYRWWADDAPNALSTLMSRTDTLDREGRLEVALTAPAPEDGRPYRLSVFSTVTDLNRQSASAATSVLVHPASIYIGARQDGGGWFWNAGDPVDLEVVAGTPAGDRRAGVAVRGVLIKREWHSAERTRDGVTRSVGGWVQDTVAACSLVTTLEPESCRVTPPGGGSYTVAFDAEDDQGRATRTSFHRWAAGPDWVPWNDQSKFKLDVIVDQEQYDVGDTATVLIAAPFTQAEAWVTIERERLIESRRIRITDGATTLKLPIDESFAPNVFVSVLMVRGRIDDPGTLQDPGRPTMRLGYAEIRVRPDVKRLQVEVVAEAPEYRPGDTARVQIAVKDLEGVGQRSEVTLWAVDKGVLALTGYTTPDPLDRIYPARGLGMYLASNLVAVAPQVPEGQKASIAPGGGGGGDLAAILRSRFKTTAFFLGSVVTDEDGRAEVDAALPDNLTTFRLMAVAVTEGDRYGSGESEFLVSLPLLARPALPRFVRPTDQFAAGVVVNSRLPDTTQVAVGVEAEGILTTDGVERGYSVPPLGGADVRFGFLATEGDSAGFTFSVEGGGEADAVRVGIPVRPLSHPLVSTMTGVLEEPVSTALIIDDDIDPARSQVEISFGTSPLAFVQGVRRRLRVYPYYCSEQVSSAALPLIALYRASQQTGRAVQEEGADEQIRRAVKILTDRQKPDGGIGYWNQGSWTSPTVTAYAGRVLLEAREAGFEVSDSVLVRMGDYLERTLNEDLESSVPIYRRWRSGRYWRRGDRVRAADFLSRLDRANVPAEHTLLENVGNLSWDSRLILAQMLGRRGEVQPARRILTQALRDSKIEGRQLILSDDVEPDDWGYGYFRSRIGHVAQLVETMMTVAPAHPMLGPAVERLVGGSRIMGSRWWWTTYDQGQAVLALARYDRQLGAVGPRQISGMIGGTRVQLEASSATSDTTLSLATLMGTGSQRVVPVYLERSDDGPPVFFYVTLSGMPAAQHPNPADQGLQVERWYEDPETGEPIVEAVEGDLVRVLMRVTTAAERGFVVLDDPLPAGLEVVDLSLRTVNAGGHNSPLAEMSRADGAAMGYGRWEYGYWSPWDHKEMRDERAVYSATVMRPGTHVATYLARATTSGSFVYPPAYAEEMYNPGVNGRSGGGRFTVRSKNP